MMEIGKNIKEYRKLRGMTQKELANLIGKKHYKSIAKYESGETSINIDTLVDISKALDVHIINLLGLEKEHKSIAKLTVDTKVNMTELEIAKAKLDQIKVLINEINNMEIKLDVEANVRR
jgi:transcriptional regulator with XRE-family HTH domain